MTERSSIFDMIGPIMIGPSSSHTAGVVRIGHVAHYYLGAVPQQVTVTFYNSFATTYEGHGSDRALLAGLMGFETDDERIRTALDIAKERGIEVHFKTIQSASKEHPNTIRIEAQLGGRGVEVLGVSRGGGLITIVELDGFHANFTAQLHTLVVKAEDTKGSIAFITDVISHDGVNIATMTVGRRSRADLACLIIEMDEPLRPTSLDYLKHLPWVKEVVYLPKVG
jgi:L-serine dehydratase